MVAGGFLSPKVKTSGDTIVAGRRACTGQCLGDCRVHESGADRRTGSLSAPTATSSNAVYGVHHGNPKRVWPTGGSGVVVDRGDTFYRLIRNTAGVMAERITHVVLKPICHGISPSLFQTPSQTLAVGPFTVTHCVDSNVVELPPHSGQGTSAQWFRAASGWSRERPRSVSM